MNWATSPYSIILLVAASVTAILSVYAWRRRGTPAAPTLALMMLAAAEWAVTYALQMVSAGLDAKVFWAKVEFLGHVIVPLAWLAFALQYTGRPERTRGKIWILLGIEPAITMLVIATNDLHHLFWTSVRIDPANPLILHREFGPWWWIDAAYSYALLVAGSFLLVRMAIRSAHLYQKQSATLLFGITVPWAANIVFLAGIQPAHSLDPTPVVFPVAGLAFALSLFRFRLLEIVPMARDAIFEEIYDGVIVLDLQERIVDVNPAAQQILGQTATAMIGRAVDEVLPEAAALRAGTSTHTHADVRLSGVNHDRSIEITSAPIRARRGSVGGRLLVLRDVSARRAAERRLAESEQRYKSLFDHNPDGVFSLDLAGNLLNANPTANHMSGYSVEDLRHMTILSLVTPDDLPRAREALARTSAGEAQNVELAITNRWGHRVDLNITSMPIVVEGNVVGIFGVAKDITERKRAEALMAGQNRVLQLIAEAAPLPAVLEALARLVQGQSPGARCSILLVSDDGRHLTLGAAPDMPDEFRRAVDGIPIADGQGCCGTAAFRQQPIISTDIATDPLWVDFRELALKHELRACWSSPVLSSSGDVLATFAIFHPEARGPKPEEQRGLAIAAHLTGIAVERALAESRLRDAEAKYRTLVEQIPAVTYIDAPVDALAEVNPTLYISPQLHALLGITPEEWIAEPHLWEALLHPDDRERVLRENARTNQTGEPYSIEYRLRTRDGRFVWVRDEAVLVRDEAGRPAFWQGLLIDITDRKRLEDQLAYQAFHDPLTGLPNRTLFLDRLKHALRRIERTQERIAVLFIDLDNFKVVNDSLGHDAGNRLLIAIAERLRRSVRAGDTAARLGGDEFTVLLEGLARDEDPVALAERIIQAIRVPIVVSGRELFVTPSIGIVIRETGDRADNLLRDADVAMYRAKAKGKACYEVFHPNMNVEARQRFDLEHDLHRAIERRELRLFYQPTVDLRTGAINGMEALLRWARPGHGLLPPGAFMQVAEETGLIIPIGQWVLREACRQAALWQGLLRTRAPRVSVNLSARQFRDPTLVADVEAALREVNLPPAALSLEIAEGVVMADSPALSTTLRALRELGVGLEIDDFGSGHSSLSHLRHLPVETLKIDRSFIAGLGENPEDSAIVAAIVDMAHALDLIVLAEGVETGAQLARLRDLDCDAAQGNYFSEPLPGPEITLVLERALGGASDSVAGIGDGVAARLPAP